MDFLKSLATRKWAVPAFTLALTLLSYALLSPRLGYYLDDWPQLYSFLSMGATGIKEYFLYDGRPFTYWPNLFFYNLWGTNPFLWHLTNYVLRWVTGLLLWWLVKLIWPSRGREAGWVAILFAVFPMFAQQSMGLTFVTHWVCYVLFLLSCALMVLAVKKPKHFFPLMLLAWAINVPTLFTYEGFIGVEFLRPVLLWFALPQDIPFWKKARRTILTWLPFLALAVFYVVWRIFILENLRADNSPVLINSFYHEPGKTFLLFMNYWVRDLIHLVFGVWFPTLSVTRIDFSSWIKTGSLLLSVLIVLVALRHLKKNPPQELVEPQPKQVHFHLKAMIVGFLGMLLGCAPGWLIMRTVSDPSGLWNDRFGLTAMFAACLFLVAGIGFLFRKTKKIGEVLLVCLVGLSVGYNLNVTEDYRQSADEQNRFYHQLYWRAPVLLPQTSLLADYEMLSKMGVYPTSFALNLLYPMTESWPRLDYWFFTVHKSFPNDLDRLDEGIEVYDDHWYAYYLGESQNSLVIDWRRDTDRCLWVLTEKDRLNPLITDNTRRILGASNLTRIDLVNVGIAPDVDLFGAVNSDNWCYFYQKSDLARQKEDWAEILRLFSEARSAGFSPSNGVELIPFVEAYAWEGQAAESLNLSLEAMQLTDDLSPMLCDTWNRLADGITDNADFTAAYGSFAMDYGCSIYR